MLFSVLQDNHFLNIVISLLVDGEYTGMYDLKCDDVMMMSWLIVCVEIDVQLVGLIKTLIDPENIMTDAAAVVSHVVVT